MKPHPKQKAAQAAFDTVMEPAKKRYETEKARIDAALSAVTAPAEEIRAETSSAVYRGREDNEYSPGDNSLAARFRYERETAGAWKKYYAEKAVIDAALTASHKQAMVAYKTALAGK